MSKAVMAVSMKALVLAAGVLLAACGPTAEPTQAPASEQPASSGASLCAEGTVCPPVASLSCTRENNVGEVVCNGSATDGVAPYRYFWRSITTPAHGPATYGAWTEGSSMYYDYCPRRRETSSKQWTLTIEMYVVDTANATSNTASVGFVCVE